MAIGRQGQLTTDQINEPPHILTKNYHDVTRNSSKASMTPYLTKGSPTCMDRSRLISGKLVNNETFQTVIISLIIVNSVIMGVATFDFVTENPTVYQLFEQIDEAFLILFTIELGLQFHHHGVNFFKSGWLIFDFVVVPLSWAFFSMEIIRTFRIIRAFRIVTRIKSLRDLISALLHVIPRMSAIAVIMLLVFYIFAVIFTHLFKSLYRDGYTSEDYFSRLDVTCLTLFQIMLLDSWSGIMKELMAVYIWAWSPVICFKIVSSFFVVNLFGAVLSDAITKSHQGGKMEDYATNQNVEIERLESKVHELTRIIDKLIQSQPTMHQNGVPIQLQFKSRE